MRINLESLLETYEKLPELIETYVSNIPSEKIDLKRNIEAWPISEHIYHIAGVQKMFLERIKKCAQEDSPKIEPFLPEHKEGALFPSIEEAFTHYKEMRQEQIAFVKTLSEDDLSREAIHGEYTQYNIPIILNHMVFHEYWHMYRIEEIWLTRDGFFS